MARPFSEDDIYFLYLHVKRFESSYFNIGKYCKINNLTLIQFTNFRYKLNFRESERFEEALAAYDLFISSGKKACLFCKEHPELKQLIDVVIAHKKYWEIIERYKKEGIDEVEFLELKTKERKEDHPKPLLSGYEKIDEKKQEALTQKLPIKKDCRPKEANSSLTILINDDIKIVYNKNCAPETILKLLTAIKEI